MSAASLPSIPICPVTSECLKGTRGAKLGKRIRHVDKRRVDVVGGKGKICGALALEVMLSE